MGNEFLARARAMGIRLLALEELQAEDFPLRLKNAVIGREV
jgi:hypothetical protein